MISAAFALVVASVAAPPPAARDVCSLLQDDEIRAVQRVPMTQRKPSEQVSRGLRVAQCFFATTDFSHSISLSVITGDGDAAVRAFWDRTFHRDAREAEEQDEPPRRIDWPGAEAFWTGDMRTGSLYVLSGGAVVRISVGGVSDEAERIRRSRTLVEAALRRLRARR